MSNVISFLRASGQPELGFGLDAVMRGVALGRRSREDLRWMKENAELLRLLVATKTPVCRDTLRACYGDFLRDALANMAFFPQYYRFFLHMVCDLRDLGLVVTDPVDLARLAQKSGAPEAELSDLLRAESAWLLTRAGLEPGPDASRVRARLNRFVANPAHFALPNRKLGYEATHIAFYTSDYGASGASAPAGLAASLRYIGILAWLEQNFDLLAECCIALTCIGADVPALWRDRLSQVMPTFRFSQPDPDAALDGYHCWLMVLWYQVLQGANPLDRPFPAHGFLVKPPACAAGALRSVSRNLLGADLQGNGDWAAVCETALRGLEDEEVAIVETAARDIDDFDAFFAAFSRAGLRRCVA